MSDKLVWSSNMTHDYFRNLIMQDPEAAKAELQDYNYELDMLNELDVDGLIDLANDDYMWQQDIEAFDNEVVPMINKQTLDGIVLMFGTAGTWTGNHKGGKAVYAEDLAGGDICEDCDEIAIYDIDGGLVWEGYHHDGTHIMNLYAVPEDRDTLIDFVDICLHKYVEYELEFDEEITEEDIIEDIINYGLDIEILNDYCDFSTVPRVCEPIRNLNNAAVGESLDESYFDGDRAVIKAIKALPDFYSNAITPNGHDLSEIPVGTQFFIRGVNHWHPEIFSSYEKIDDNQWRHIYDYGTGSWDNMLSDAQLMMDVKNSLNESADEPDGEPVNEEAISEGLNVGDKIIVGGDSEGDDYNPFVGAKLEVISIEPFELRPLNREGEDYWNELVDSDMTAEDFYSEVVDDEDNFVEIVKGKPVNEAELPELEEPEEPVEKPVKKIKSKYDVDALAEELEELEEDYDDFGAYGFYAVPFDSFKREFPEFTKDVIMSWLIKMELETKEDLQDSEYVNDAWANGELIMPDDWPALFDGARIYIKGANVQWDKVYKKYSKAPNKY